MGQFEVTRDLYKAVMGKDPSEAPANGVEGQNPVNCVRRGDAIMFCNKLSKLCGLECVYYLEIDVAKGKSKTDANLKTVAWFYFNSKDKTNVVGLKTKNSLNIYDMNGNVWDVSPQMVWYVLEKQEKCMLPMHFVFHPAA